MSIITGKNIDKFRLRVLRSALKLEALGMKRRGASALSIVKREFGFKGSRQAIMEKMDLLIASATIDTPEISS